MAKAKRALWFGFLEAGDKGGSVVRDDRLSTGNPGTVYLFSSKKGKIVEYRRDIVESKLRELTPDEEGEWKSGLLAGFEAACLDFVPRKVVKRVAPVRKKEVELDFDADTDVDDGADDDADDDVIELSSAPDDFDD